ncbi:hypothetical protein Ocin01_06777 [Orchesella cincta]|uniref:Uncharacterized protein n=1 Tax=Orchesella cincta TaxID=48709 RepID=A0A1D2N3R2_ORCCI|nr:hypothetical protein Ocin01_06777 [Orchesella cincta]
MFLPLSILLLVFDMGLSTDNLSGTPHLQLSPGSEMTYEEEYKHFEADQGSSSSHLSREKRFIYLNVDANMAMAMLVSIPLTFILPSMTNLFNSWRRKRSIEDSSLQTMNIQENSVVKPDMDKVFSYFQLLDIPEVPCQLRAMCEFSADPEKFYPLSDVLLRKIRNPHLPALVYLEGQENDVSSSNSSSWFNPNSKQRTSLYELYNRAADEGQVNGYDKCEEQFTPTCQYPMEKLLNMPVIRFWNALQSVLKLSFKDVAFK